MKRAQDHARIKKIMREIEGDKFTPPVPAEIPGDDADDDFEGEAPDGGEHASRLFGKPNAIHIHIALGKKK